MRDVRLSSGPAWPERRVLAFQATRHVDVVGPRIFQREANEFAASLDSRPIERTRKPWCVSPANDDETASLPRNILPSSGTACVSIQFGNASTLYNPMAQSVPTLEALDMRIGDLWL
jgi:hypothetical protein